MKIESAFGWRPITSGYSSGLDFLGLAAPIEGILDAETGGITNATRRVRYFSLVPWYYWKYAKRGGEGNAQDQRQFAIGFEMLIAYANIAWRESSESKVTGVIREDYSSKKWKEGRTKLPLRGDDVGDTPSPVDAALYGPSLRRLNLLGRYGQLQTCRDAGAVMAEELDKTLGQKKSYFALMDAATVERAIVEEWANDLSLALPTAREIMLLRAVLFSYGQFARDDIPPRVHTMLLLLNLALTADAPFTSDEIESALASGRDLRGNPFSPDPPLRDAHKRWRILVLLKFLRHAAELAFGAVHGHVRNSALRFGTAEAAALDLIEEAVSKHKGVDALPRLYEKLVAGFADAPPPGWGASGDAPDQVLRHAIALCAWCHAILRTDSGQLLLDDDMARVGQHLDADLLSYSEHFEQLLSGPITDALRWLCVDRGVARHFNVAARKLAQHDTFRLIEDEEGVRATDACPIPDIAIRVDSMLSLISDLKLIERAEGGYVTSTETKAWYKAQIEHVG